eukprot:COSAG02_NODE_6485_length_3543_cov_2.301394_2_plen_156_part_00
MRWRTPSTPAALLFCLLLPPVAAAGGSQAEGLLGERDALSVQPEFVLHRTREHDMAASAAVGRNVVVEAGGDPWYLTAIQTIDSSEDQREPKFVWTIDGLPYAGKTIGPISVDSCPEDGIGVELVELRAVTGTSWFDSRDIVTSLDCNDGRRTEL